MKSKFRQPKFKLFTRICSYWLINSIFHPIALVHFLRRPTDNYCRYCSFCKQYLWGIFTSFNQFIVLFLTFYTLTSQLHFLERFRGSNSSSFKIRLSNYLSILNSKLTAFLLGQNLMWF